MCGESWRANRSQSRSRTARTSGTAGLWRRSRHHALEGRIGRIDTMCRPIGQAANACPVVTGVAHVRSMGDGRIIAADIGLSGQRQPCPQGQAQKDSGQYMPSHHLATPFEEGMSWKEATYFPHTSLPHERSRRRSLHGNRAIIGHPINVPARNASKGGRPLLALRADKSPRINKRPGQGQATPQGQRHSRGRSRGRRVGRWCRHWGRPTACRALRRLGRN